MIAEWLSGPFSRTAAIARRADLALPLALTQRSSNWIIKADSPWLETPCQRQWTARSAASLELSPLDSSDREGAIAQRMADIAPTARPSSSAGSRTATTLRLGPTPGCRGLTGSAPRCGRPTEPPNSGLSRTLQGSLRRRPASRARCQLADHPLDGAGRDAAHVSVFGDGDLRGWCVTKLRASR